MMKKKILFCKLVFLCNNNLSYALTIIRVENIVRIWDAKKWLFYSSPRTHFISFFFLETHFERFDEGSSRSKGSAEDSTVGSRGSSTRAARLRDRSILFVARDVTLQPSGYRYQRRNAMGNHARNLQTHVR